MTNGDSTERVRVVVVNYNAGKRLLRCVEDLLSTEWPRELLDIVVVDNASSDGSADDLELRFPDVTLLRSPANLGFAGGSNFGMRDLEDDVAFVALVNNDAFVEPDWLEPLAAALRADDRVGASCPKIVFANRYVRCQLESPSFTPGNGDTRDLGVIVSGVRNRGIDLWRDLHVESGGFWEEHGPGGPFRWLGPSAELWVPVPPDAGGATRVQLRLHAERPKEVRVRCGDLDEVVEVGPAPQWFSLDASDTPFDVINNVGSVLVQGAYGADRGFWEEDRGQYEEPTDVFAWCGAAVLLRREYLDDVGLFDDEYFLYYEDLDLSWRGQLRGWKYRYVPSAVVRHIHSASTIEGSALFEHYVSRNRLLTLVKNAPVPVVVGQGRQYLRELWEIARTEIVTPMIRRQPHSTVRFSRRLRSAVGCVRLLPDALQKRRTIGHERAVDRSEVLPAVSA